MKIYMAQFESIVCKMEIVGEFEALQIMLLISKKNDTTDRYTMHRNSSKKLYF